MSDDHNQEVWVMAIIMMTDLSSPNFIYWDAADRSSHCTVYRVSSLYTPIEQCRTYDFFRGFWDRNILFFDGRHINRFSSSELIFQSFNGALRS